MGDLIRFPVESVGRPANTLEEIQSNIETVRHVYVNDMTESLVGMMAQQMEAGGFNLLDDSHKRDFGFLIETVRSTLSKTIGLYHPFQDIAEDLMQPVGMPEDGFVAISDEVLTKYMMKETDVDLQNSPEASPEIL